MSFRLPDGAAIHRLDDYRTAVPAVPGRSEDEVWAEIVAAGELFGALSDAGLRVHFDAAGPSRAPRVCVIDRQGRVVRELSLSVACDPADLENELLSADG